jgi:excisionase family DNA binding protein
MGDTTRLYDTTSASLYDATGRDEIMTVADAANVLGITPGAVRKRLERGQLSGQKVGNTWRIMLNATEATRRDTTLRQHQTRHHDTTGDDSTTDISPAARSQLEAIRDEWLLPLVDRIGVLEREAGQLQAQRDAAQRERDDLADRLAEERGLADQFVDILQAERDVLAAQLHVTEAGEPPPPRRGRGRRGRLVSQLAVKLAGVDADRI